MLPDSIVTAFDGVISPEDLSKLPWIVGIVVGAIVLALVVPPLVRRIRNARKQNLQADATSPNHDKSWGGRMTDK
jgi:hypothetical protein